MSSMCMYTLSTVLVLRKANNSSLLTVKDLRKMGRGVTHWMMAISADELEQLTNHT